MKLPFRATTGCRHMRSHSVTCHPTQVNTPSINLSQTGPYSIYLPRSDGRVSWLTRGGQKVLSLATFRYTFGWKNVTHF